MVNFRSGLVLVTMDESGDEWSDESEKKILHSSLALVTEDECSDGSEIDCDCDESDDGSGGEEDDDCGGEGEGNGNDEFEGGWSDDGESDEGRDVSYTSGTEDRGSDDDGDDDSVDRGVSKDDISTAYRGRTPIDPKNERRTRGSLIIGFPDEERPKATKDDCWTVYREKAKRSWDLASNPILWHGKDIYTPGAFRLFYIKYKKSEHLQASIVSQTVDDTGNNVLLECEVFTPGRCGTNKVYAESGDGTVNCSCRKFDWDGILCSHAIAVLDCLCIVRIPHQYVTREFARDDDFCVKGEIHGPKYGELLRFACYEDLHDKICMKDFLPKWKLSSMEDFDVFGGN